MSAFGGRDQHLFRTGGGIRKGNREMEPINISWMEFATVSAYRKGIVVDLRDASEYKRGHVRGAMNYSEYRLEQALKQYRNVTRICVYCDRGNTSLRVCRDLRKQGFSVINIWGGVHELFYGNNVSRKKLIDAIWEKY